MSLLVGSLRIRKPTCSIVALIVLGILADLGGMRLGFVLFAVVLLTAAFVFHERRSVLESRLGAVATQLAGRPVHVQCQSVAGDLIDVTPEAGSVHFNADGSPGNVTKLKRDVCDALRRYPHDVRTPAYGCVIAGTTCPARIFDDVQAVSVLAHESWHLRGNTSESLTECHSLQTTALAASLFGADTRAAQATADYVWVRIYPNMPDEYRTPVCGNGGPMDLRPTDPLWP
jgi:hypothetical protein